MRVVPRFVLATLVVAALSIVDEDAAVAQPLVTGGLTIYLDFDEIVQVEDPDGNTVDGFADESGNGWNGYIGKSAETDIDPGELTLKTGADAKRGAGAANFRQSTDTLDNPIFVGFDGPSISATDTLPSDAFTIAAWVNVDNLASGDGSVFQSRSSGGGFNHIQVQRSGKLRFHLRGEAPWENITGGGSTVPDQFYTDGTTDDVNPGPTYPIGEWFHYAGTYDRATNEYAVFFNGEEIHRSEVNDAIPMGNWEGLVVENGDWFSAGIGAVTDGPVGDASMARSMSFTYSIGPSPPTKSRV